MAPMATEGVVRKITFTVDNTYPYPQSSKPVVGVNYAFPGPTIEVNENDTLQIRVINKLPQGTTLHWHGLFQRGTQDMDGAVGATQCPIPPNAEMTYTFKAFPGGTTWYHGHYLDQYADGLVGPLIIHRAYEPSQALYRTERTLIITDWYNDVCRTTLNSWYLSPSNPDAIEPIPDGIAVNGKFSESLFVNANGEKLIRFRIINAAAFSMYTVSIDGLQLKIIELDQTPVKPYTVSSFAINVAQRVSFCVDLNQFNQSIVPSGLAPTKSIYIRITAMADMYPVDIATYIPPYKTPSVLFPTFFNPSYLAYLTFGSSNSLPTYPAHQEGSNPPPPGNISDTNLLDARPFYRTNIPNANHYLKLVVDFYEDSSGIVRAYFNDITYGSNPLNLTSTKKLKKLRSSPNIPLLYQMTQAPNGIDIPPPIITSDSPLPSIQSDKYGHYLIPYGAVVDIYIENRDAGEHPFHLHGYSFWIIATSENPQAENLYAGDYVQRDTVSVPASGWAKLRFVANNPGAWLFHCHIEWHMDAGLLAAFIVGPQQLAAQKFTYVPPPKKFCQ
ncbi:unnamed protein product [Rotaria sp. Silwood1]|nr:unnamed protein product [Rotaria sp. Silwood1]CAF1622760.1 unnamed protein product [Rotaria sp. Silwood1]